MGESYADLLRRAVRRPASLTEQDSAHIAPEDRRLIVETLDAALARADAQLVALTTGKPYEPIPQERWAYILERARTGELLATELTIDEIRAIDNDPRLAEEFERASFWGSPE